ncbi:MAG: hypothetical protein PHF46_01220 [Candidatus Gracilibacteria bacterium]|nr:hypothetical protein [Candidatus Gracilibacteria bacterium]MDD3120011.1 hypothetical protein [Candidatus Gracilibacteria bacterium]MDD4529996.1 hypothetical protein [Candidatus Gracilibacteria bacterium]
MKKKIFLSTAGLVLILTSQQAFSADLKEISCATDYFKSNACDQCFQGGNVDVGSPITGFDDDWTNPSSMPQVIYDAEQVMPSLVNLGGTTTVWDRNPKSDTVFWKFSSNIVWKDSVVTTANSKTNSGSTKLNTNTGPNVSSDSSNTETGIKEFYLDKGKTVKFLESSAGASYVLNSTDKKSGDPIGIIKYVIKYHDVDQDGNDGKLKTHNECAAYFLGKAPIKAIEKTEPKPNPKEVTKVKTGPEVYMLFLIAMLGSILYIRFKSIKD